MVLLEKFFKNPIPPPSPPLTGVVWLEVWLSFLVHSHPFSGGRFLLLTYNNGFMQVGVGMCMEGIEQNPVVYELMSEMAFRNEKVQVLVIIDFQY